jgi:hypothetical protein
VSLPKAILVNADGTTEPLPADEACGVIIIRHTKCPGGCGTSLGTRKYVSHWAHNQSTRVAGKRLVDAKGPPNDGCIVFIEEPA